MVNRKNFDARNLQPRAPKSPGPALNHQLGPALDQITSEGETRPSTSCHQFTEFPAALQYQAAFAPDQHTFGREIHPSTSSHQFTEFPAALQYQAAFAPDQHTFGGEIRPSTSSHQFTEFPAALQYQAAFAPDQHTFGGEIHPSTSSHQFTASPAAPQYQPVFATAPEQGRMDDDNNNNNNVLVGFEKDALAELEMLRKHNRILRSNNVSIMKLKNEMEARALAAERKVELLERELKDARGAL